MLLFNRYSRKLLPIIFLISVGICISPIASAAKPTPAPNLPNGVSVGDMLYWSGTAWTILPAPSGPLTAPESVSLKFCNGKPAWGPCLPSGYLSFTKVGQFLSGVDSNLPLGNAVRSVDVWFRTSSNTVGFPFEWGGWTGTVVPYSRFGLGIVNSLPAFIGQSLDLWGDATVNDSVWHKVTLIYDQSSISIYVDGVLDISSSTSDTNGIQFSNLNTTNADLRIGTSHYGEQFIGDISAVAVYNRVLSSNEISNVALPNGNESGLVSFYDLSKVTASNLTVTNQVDSSTTLKLVGFD